MWKMLELDSHSFLRLSSDIEIKGDSNPFFLLLLAAFLLPSRRNPMKKGEYYHDENIFLIMKVHYDEGQWDGGDEERGCIDESKKATSLSKYVIVVMRGEWKSTKICPQPKALNCIPFLFFFYHILNYGILEMFWEIFIVSSSCAAPTSHFHEF